MKSHITTLFTVLVFSIQVHAAEKARIGVYDSRCVAIAYVNTPMFKSEMKALTDTYAQAKAAGDTAKIKECEAKGKAQQQQLHRQGFSTAPVDDILAKITNEVAQIKADEKVTLLVSRWDTVTLKKYPKAEQVDVTAKLIDAFHPNDRQRKAAQEIQKQKPVPLDQIDKVMESEGR